LLYSLSAGQIAKIISKSWEKIDSGGGDISPFAERDTKTVRFVFTSGKNPVEEEIIY